MEPQNGKSKDDDCGDGNIPVHIYIMPNPLDQNGVWSLWSIKKNPKYNEHTPVTMFSTTLGLVFGSDKNANLQYNMNEFV